MKTCIVIGGGIIGLCSAYYLINEGHQVTIIDQSKMDSGASYCNAGYISPGHIIPLSAPGVMKKGLKWMFNPASPLYIKPRMDMDFLTWAFQFNKSCNATHVKKSIPVIKEISVLSQELYKGIKESDDFNFHMEKKGILMLCQTDKLLEEEAITTQLAVTAGLEAKMLSQDELKAFEPNVALNVKGGSIYNCDAHSTPMEFMLEMKGYLKGKGVQFYADEQVLDLEIEGYKIKKIQTSKQDFSADEIILTAGSWTGLMANSIGVKMPMQAGKGYSISSYRTHNISMPAILTEAKVAVTPMNGFTRFGGTMEIAGISDSINKKRVNAIANAVMNYYPENKITASEKQQAASGLRPLSADGLPYIGRPQHFENLTIATGHAMMGWSMATGTGKIVAEIVSDKKTSLNLAPFKIERFN